MKKYMIGYKDNTIIPLQLFLPKMTGYLNIFENGTKKMSFFTDNNEFLERYTKIWEKISNLIDKKFDSDPVYNNKCINTKTRSYNNDNKAYRCMSLISLDSIIKINKKYYP